MDRAKISTCLTALAVLAGCGRGDVLKVGSKNFTEQLVLGEIVAQHLERRLGVRVDRRLNLGGTLLAHQALLSGQIDLYPEYSGTALTTILRREAAGDSSAVLDRVRGEYRKLGLEWMDPLGFNNTFVMVVRGDDARRHGWETLSDAAKFAEGFTLGTGYEFQERPDGYASLTRAYNIRWRGAPKTMDLGLLYRALEQKQVSMIASNATDGVLARLDAKVLADDRQVFPPYDAAVVVRVASLERFPGMRDALAELSGKFSEDTMRRLNYQVDSERKSLAAVAAGFLVEAGLAN